MNVFVHGLRDQDVGVHLAQSEGIDSVVLEGKPAGYVRITLQALFFGAPEMPVSS